jgi:hypothetical protein
MASPVLSRSYLTSSDLAGLASAIFPRVDECFAPGNGPQKVQPFRQKRCGYSVVVETGGRLVVAAAIALKTGFLIARKM